MDMFRTAARDAPNLGFGCFWTPVLEMAEWIQRWTETECPELGARALYHCQAPESHIADLRTGEPAPDLAQWCVFLEPLPNGSQLISAIYLGRRPVHAVRIA